MAFTHGSVNEMSKLYLANERRYNYTTPKSFLELVQFLHNAVVMCVYVCVCVRACVRVCVCVCGEGTLHNVQSILPIPTPLSK